MIKEDTIGLTSGVNVNEVKVKLLCPDVFSNSPTGKTLGNRVSIDCRVCRMDSELERKSIDTLLVPSHRPKAMPPKPSVRGEYIETETGNKISRRASVLGPRHIILAGKCVIQQDVVIHGDLVRPPQPKPPAQKEQSDQKAATQDQTSIHLGRYVFISPGCTLHPPSRLTTVPAPNGGEPEQIMTYFMLRISDYVYIGPNTHIRAAEIRSNVWIGANCTIGNMVMIKDNVKILDGTVLPANTVWAGGTIIAGRPGRVIGEVGEGWAAGSSSGSTVDEGVGVKSRERWAAVGNKR